MLATPLRCSITRCHQLQTTRTFLSLLKKKTSEPTLEPVVESETASELIADTSEQCYSIAEYVEPVEPGALAVREPDGRSVPLLILPHSVKKAYHLDIHTPKVTRVLQRKSWVTKTLLTHGLPKQYEDEVDMSNYEQLLQEYHEILQQTFAATKLPRNVKRRQLVRRLDFNLFWDVLRLTTRYSPGAEHLRVENSFLFHKPTVETFWARSEGYEGLDDDHDMKRQYTPTPRFFHTKFEPNFVLRTKDKLGPIEDLNAATPDYLDLQAPQPSDTFALNTYLRPVINLRHKPGIDNFTQSPHQHTHTTFLHNYRFNGAKFLGSLYDQFASSSMLTSHSQMVAQANAEGNYNGMELQHPYVTQCVMTDGHRVSFLVYQLNTLCTQDDQGVWNRAWYSGPLNMFEAREKSKVPPSIFGDGVSDDGGLRGFNPDVFRLLLKFTRMETV